MTYEVQRAVAQLLPSNPHRNLPLYVDKTLHLSDFYSSIGQKVILTRPPHFGKSTALQLLLHLHCSPLQFIESALDHHLQTDREWWLGSSHYSNMTNNQVRNLYERTPLECRRQFPPLYFDLEPHATSSPLALREYIITQTQRFNSAYGLKQDINDIRTGLNRLLQAIPASGQELPAVFIDGFDAPIRNRWDPTYNDKLAVLDELGEALKTQVKLVFCTGRSADPQLLDLSNWVAFEDISNREKYANLCGFRWKEVVSYCESTVREAQRKVGMEERELGKKLQEWYGGYRFGNKVEEPLLCPLSLTRFFSTFSFQNYRDTPESQEIASILKHHPHILTTSSAYEQRKDKVLFTAGYDPNPFNLHDSLGVLYRLGLLAPYKIAYPSVFHLQVANKSAAEVLYRMYVNKSLGEVVRRVKQALLPTFQPDHLQRVITEAYKVVSVEALKTALLMIGEIEGIGKVWIEKEYVDLRVGEKYTLRVNFVAADSEENSCFLRKKETDLSRTAVEYGLEVACTSTAVTIPAIGELLPSGYISKATTRPRKRRS